MFQDGRGCVYHRRAVFQDGRGCVSCRRSMFQDGLGQGGAHRVWMPMGEVGDTHSREHGGAQGAMEFMFGGMVFDEDGAEGSRVVDPVIAWKSASPRPSHTSAKGGEEGAMSSAGPSSQHARAAAEAGASGGGEKGVRRSSAKRAELSASGSSGGVRFTRNGAPHSAPATRRASQGAASEADDVARLLRDADFWSAELRRGTAPAASASVHPAVATSNSKPSTWDMMEDGALDGWERQSADDDTFNGLLDRGHTRSPGYGVAEAAHRSASAPPHHHAGAFTDHSDASDTEDAYETGKLGGTISLSAMLKETFGEPLTMGEADPEQSDGVEVRAEDDLEESGGVEVRAEAGAAVCGSVEEQQARMLAAIRPLSRVRPSEEVMDEMTFSAIKMTALFSAPSTPPGSVQDIPSKKPVESLLAVPPQANGLPAEMNIPIPCEAVALGLDCELETSDAPMPMSARSNSSSSLTWRVSSINPTPRIREEGQAEWVTEGKGAVRGSSARSMDEVGALGHTLLQEALVGEGAATQAAPRDGTPQQEHPTGHIWPPRRDVPPGGDDRGESSQSETDGGAPEELGEVDLWKKEAEAARLERSLHPSGSMKVNLSKLVQTLDKGTSRMTTCATVEATTGASTKPRPSISEELDEIEALLSACQGGEEPKWVMSETERARGSVEDLLLEFEER
ncbi:hypothetical protein CYMTET_52326 [Cymbomonas tetramitiformis]|uniref:Uncharacterized protein n=1 Tax=Cymbomonas tetramitiformis TaxID=36881 RepID=A0AAE0BJ73_9CHLO|nr:hypothetical protein CYMTET_52326 [Cymbomonas tetramitiformis]